MRVRNQLIIGYTTLLVVTLVTGVVAVAALSTTTSRFERVARDLSSDLIAVQRLQFEAEQVVATSRGYLLTGDARSLETFTESSITLQTSLALLQLRTHLAYSVGRIESAARAYATAAEEAAMLRKGGDPTVVSFFESTLSHARDQFAGELTQFVESEQERFDEASRLARDSASHAQGLLIGATAVGVAIGLLLAGLSIRRLTAQYTRERAATADAQRAAAARDEMLAVVSHDLRNPLTTVTMAAAMLDETVDEPRTLRHVAAITHAAGRMQHLIEELLDVAKLESGTFTLHVEPVDAGSLIMEAQSLFQTRAANAQIDLVVEPFEGVTVVADRERVLQVLSNLIGNAFKFTPAGGSITMSLVEAGGVARFCVRDTGRGIAEDHLPHLFERFWQGRARGRGSLGLGLYICKQLVEAHHGEISVESTPDKGSTFSFTLPRA